MRIRALVLALVIIVSLAGDAEARHVIKAYFNGQEATVTGVSLKIGEPFTIDLYVTPDRCTTVSARLREPGGGLESYRRISGDSVDKVRKDGGPNDTVHYQWVLAPTDAWAGGTAPLNIQYNVWGETMDGDVQGYFTVMEAYVLPEKYSPPAQAGAGPLANFFAAAAAMAAAARHRVTRNTKAFYIWPPLLRAHAKQVIQYVKNKKCGKIKRDY